MVKAKHISLLTNGPASLSSLLSTNFFLPPSEEYMITWNYLCFPELAVFGQKGISW